MGTCNIPGCTKDNGKGRDGMCAMHTQRVRRHGNPDYVTSKEQWRALCRAAQPTIGQCKDTTYPKFHGRHAHRVVAEQMLGRPLRRGEIVHHKDGNKHNNDPSNLEILTQSEHIKHHWPEMHAIRMQKRASSK